MTRRIGFTLIEVVIVLTILIMIASLGIPALQGTLAQQELKSSADKIRGIWLETRVRAMEEGQIFYMRSKLGGSAIVVDRVLDTHFTAGLSSRQTTTRFDSTNQFDPFEKGGFTGEGQDFLIRDPDTATEGTGVILDELPKSVAFADVIVAAEERAAFYLGLIDPYDTEVEEYYEIDALTTGDIRLGETSNTDGTAWSAPIFFYPDGTTSTAALLLKNKVGRCIEARLRGINGNTTLTTITSAENYVGELEANRF